MHEKAKFVCFNYMQLQKLKFKSVQINMKHVSYIIHWQCTFIHSCFSVIFVCFFIINHFLDRIVARLIVHITDCLADETNKRIIYETECKIA